MKTIFTSLGLLLLFAIPMQAQDDDQSLSPYFLVQGGEEGLDVLPLKHSEAEINVAGVIADVTIRQVYQNEGEKPLEALYVFPASTRAAVYAMTMTLADRRIEAQIKEKAEARAIYQEALSAGQTASLLEQQRPNVFKMNVANILPGDSIVVEMSYTELLVPEEGVYEFVYPTVVGPRYSEDEAAATPEEDWVKSPYSPENTPPSYTFDLKARIAAGMPIHALMSPSHELEVKWQENGNAHIFLDPNEAFGGNRDFVLRYRLAGEQINSGLLTYDDGEEQFFLWMVQPPERVEPAEIPAREYIFIVDVSGSMNGFPINVSKSLMRELLSQLKPEDRFNVILFASTNAILSDLTSIAASEENINSAISFIENERGAGGTSLLPALERALKLKETEGYSRSLVLCSDGFITVEPEAFDLIREELDEANFFSFGIGTSVNRHLVEGLAKVGMGEPFVVLNEREAKLKAKKFREYIEAPVLTDIELDFGKMEVYDVEPLHIPDAFAERPILVYGKFKGQINPDIVLSGVTGKGIFVDQLKEKQIISQETNRALKYLWARERIRRLGDYQGAKTKDNVSELVTELGLKYNLLTENTSFVAVDKVVRNTAEAPMSVKQSLPLPEGVTDHAVSVVDPGSKTPTLYGESDVRKLAIRGGRTVSTDYYVDGVKARSGSAFGEGLTLDEVVVSSYATTAEYGEVVSTTLGYSESHISQTYRSNLSSYLDGNVSGLQVIEQSGAPGSPVSIRLRGNSSISSSAEPLYIIDGVPQEEVPKLNPSDIANMTILKDGAATAIYGSRASNGVVIIQSQQASSYMPRWQFQSRYGMQMLSRKLALPSARNYADWLNQQQEKTIFALDTVGPGTDWQDALFKMGHFQQYRLSYQYPGTKAKLRSALSYQDHMGIIPGTRYQQIATNINGLVQLNPNLALKYGLQGHYNHNQLAATGLLGGQSLIWQMSRLSPLAELRKESGEWNLQPNLQSPGSPQMIENPLAQAELQSIHQKQASLSGNLKMDWQIREKLRYIGILSSSLGQYQYTQFDPRQLLVGQPYGGRWQDSRAQQLVMNTEHILRYEQKYSYPFQWNLEAGIQNQLFRLNYVGEQAFGLNDMASLQAADSSFEQGLNQDWYQLRMYVNSYLSYKDFLYARLGFGSQRASILSKGEKWALFPAGEIRWDFKEQLSISFLRQGSITLGWGQSGNESLLSFQRMFGLGQQSQGVPLYWVQSLPFEQLQWELSQEWSAVLKGRLKSFPLGLQLNAYNKNTQNLLAPIPQWANGQISYAVQNVGKVRNRGLELELNFEKNLKRFYIDLGLNGSFNQNQVLELGNRPSFLLGVNQADVHWTPLSNIALGSALGGLYGYETNGRYIKGDDFSMESHKQIGDWKLVDQNADGRIDAADMIRLGNSLPKYLYGLYGKFQYRKIGLEAQLAGAAGFEVLNFQKGLSTALPTSSFEANDQLIESGNFLRLRDLNLSYQLDLNRIKVFKVYVGGENLWLWTPYSGYDPEVFYGLGGQNLAIDAGAYPRARMIYAGIKMGF